MCSYKIIADTVLPHRKQKSREYGNTLCISRYGRKYAPAFFSGVLTFLFSVFSVFKEIHSFFFLYIFKVRCLKRAKVTLQSNQTKRPVQDQTGPQFLFFSFIRIRGIGVVPIPVPHFLSI